MKAANQSPTRFLTLAGCASLLIGIIHVPPLFIGEEAARFFNAPGYVRVMIRDHSPLIWLVLLVVLTVFGLFGGYALSAAGKLRRLPALKAGLIAIASVYTLRGLVLLPQLVMLIRKPAFVPGQAPVFSAVSLLVGVCYWLGLREYLQSRAPSDAT